MYLLIYSLRRDVRAVCHAHPPIATGFAAAGMPLDKPILSEAVFALGCVPLSSVRMPRHHRVVRFHRTPAATPTPFYWPITAW